ncbi:MAG: type II toxin-antitoxin system RelE/ParE family toxin [Clostridiales bacterium]|jgi:addiction module RelE/StbE family toxin|nr:type II toxin-antitoxin system RelE/ParE family toxin [Clostridiales bacterium]
MYKIEVLSEAKQDLKNIYFYIKNTLKNKKAAEDLNANFRKAFKTTCSFPLRGSIFKENKKYRKLFVGNYVIFYKAIVESETIKIYRILYAPSDIDNKELE